MRDLYEAGIRISPKTVPLSFQRLEENVAISSFLPPPPSERKKTVDETCGKGGGGNRECDEHAVHVVVARFARNDNAWMALIREIESRV